MTSDDAFLQTLRATFKVEAAEHLQTIGAGLLALERAPETAERLPIIETVFRAAHSLKGAARAVSFTDIESICQSLESVFASWKRGESAPNAKALDVAHRALDEVAAMLDVPAVTAMPRPHAQPDALAPRATSASTQATMTAQPPKAPTLPASAAAKSADTETVRISVNSLDRRLLEAEELLAAKLAVNARAGEITALLGQLEQWRKECLRIQPQARALRRATEHNGDATPVPASVANGLTEFVDWNNDHLRSFEARVTALRRAADHDRLVVGKLVDDMLENSKKLLMLPLATLGLLLPKTVRDLCRDQGKEADLVIHGEDVKIDKRILEEIKDPLIHLLRNCVDHGIEPPGARQKAGKPPRATILLSVTQVNGNQVEIALQDDGSGIEVDKVKASAIKRGLLTAEAAASLSTDAALRLVFEPDVSTSPMITQVSGRGLGLAIVREKTEKLGGRVTIDSTRGAGTTIRMLLPLTLATFRGVIIECAQRLFIVPTAQIERAIRFRPADVQTVENRETMSLQGRTIALADLSQVLGLPSARQNGGEEPAARPALILGVGEQRVAFAVDAIVDEREVLVKRLARPLSRVRNVAGATVLGSGEVAPILNVTDLLKSARHVSSSTRVAQTITPAAAPAKRVLVAEDSITSRMLIKGILESAGYDVKTAVDGMDAFTSLRSERFDVLVSDVEMPRLNGFDLTARVRGDRNLSELPVILVTALESREDRERGIDVGASAYLVKSDLDQSNLLEALRRLA
jgi:two-component system chemotaxis sensor kinase CheA